MDASGSGTGAERRHRRYAQARDAAALLVRALDRATQAHGGGAYDAPVLYAAAVTTLMRLAYLRVAADHGLLAPADASSLKTLHERLRGRARRGEALGECYDAWPRLLAIFGRVHRGGVGLPSDGGALFDPARAPCLGASDVRGDALPINNDTVLQILQIIDAITTHEVLEDSTLGHAPFRSGGDADGAVETIGRLYETLCDGEAARATERLLVLAGTRGRAPIVPLAWMEALRTEGADALLTYLRRETGRTPRRLRALLTPRNGAATAVPAACQGDTELWSRVRPFAALLRPDTAATPAVIASGEVYVTGGAGRRRAGMHYTPRVAAATIVRWTLEQVAYDGPAADRPREGWRLRPSADLLTLTVCDMAMGCGVFLVEACRYLAARVAEAWQAEATPPSARPTGAEVDSRHVMAEGGIARAPDALIARAIRLVADNCLYGVDKDPIAVELAKLALWVEVEGRRAKGEGGERAMGERGDALPSLDNRLRVGDALVGEPAYLRPSPFALRPFDWPSEFPAVFKRPDGRAGFDAIVGNPPFGNAIEGATVLAAPFRRYAAARYGPFASGAGDYCLLFWARALLHLLAPDGAYGWLSPTALLSDLKPWQEWVHAHARPTALILYPVDLFPAARIRTTGYCGRRGRAASVTVTVLDGDAGGPSSPRMIPWPPGLERWYEIVRPPPLARAPTLSTGRDEAETTPLATLPLRLHAGCAAGAAYDLVPFIVDRREGRGARLVTTGALDRYACSWGRAPIRYLGARYHHPRWPAHDEHGGHGGIPAGVARALSRQREPKILIGGLTTVLECWLDTDGDAAGVVSTWVVAPTANAPLDGLYALLAVLNSATFSRLYMERYGARSMSGKQTTIYQGALRAMPCPTALAPVLRGDAAALDGAASLDQPAGLLATCAVVARTLQGMPAGNPRRGALDKFGHLLAGLLYGRGGVGAEDDYLWWCERTATRPRAESLSRLVDALAGLLYGRGGVGAEDDALRA